MMTNVTFKREGNRLIIEVLDLTQRNGLSASKRSEIVASTGGFQAIDPASGIAFNLNVVAKVGR